jgi:ribosomal protein S18 acetylase RimI-like enzyme
MTQISLYSNDTHRAEVIRLWRDVFGYAAAHSDPGLTIDKKLAVADGMFFVALNQGCVVGTVLAGYDGHRGWLYSLAIHPMHRQQGLGKALVAHAEETLANKGCMKVNLQIMGGNEAVTAFYESLGFTVEPRISMGKRIAANIPGT